MTFAFEPKNGNGRHQLIESNWYWPFRNQAHPVYIDYTPWNLAGALKPRLIITAEDGEDSVSNDLRTGAEANKLVRILENLKIKQEDLLDTRLPLDLNPEITNHWTAIVYWMFKRKK